MYVLATIPHKQQQRTTVSNVSELAYGIITLNHGPVGPAGRACNAIDNCLCPTNA